MRSKKAIHNLIASLVLQIITAISGIILPKLFIEAYGSNINGMVASINQFLRYLSLVEAGLGAASIAALYGPLASSNFTQINSILSASRNFYRKSGYIFTILISLLAIAYPFLIEGQVPRITSSIMVVILAGSGLVEYFIIGKYRVLLMADQKSYVISVIQAFGVILNTVISIIFILAGFDIIVTQSVATLIFISRVFFIIKYVKKRYSYIDFNVTPDNKAIDKRWDALIHQLTSLIVFNTPIIIITIFCGLSEVSVYSVYSMAFAAVHMLVSAFSTGLMAGFGQVIAKNDRGILLKSYSTYEYIYYIVLTCVYTCAAVLIIPFIEIYTNGIHDTNYNRPTVAFLFVIAGIVSNIRIPHSTMVNAAGHFRETKYSSIIEAVINLTSSLILVQFFGLIGVLLGAICSNVYRTPELILYTSKYILKQTVWLSLRRILRSILLGICSSVILIYFFSINPTSLLQWFIYGLLVGIGIFIFVILGNLIFEPLPLKMGILRIKGLLKTLFSKYKIKT